MDIKKILMDRIQCDENESKAIEDDLLAISPQLQQAVNKWLIDETIDEEIVIDGYSIKQLMDTYDMQFTGAVLTMDWLIKDPDNARIAIRQGVR